MGNKNIEYYGNIDMMKLFNLNENKIMGKGGKDNQRV
jgi:hypothetical protein